MLNFDMNMNEIVQQAFGNTKKFVRMGILSCLFYFITIYTMINGLMPLISGF